MPAYDSGFKIVARTSGRQLADVAMSPVDEWLPVVSEVQTAERFADRAFRARRGNEWFVVYLEAYTYLGLIGREHMKESALYAEIGDEARVETAQADVLAVLEERLGGQEAASCRDAVQRVIKQDKLRRLLRLAARCANIEAFQRGLRTR
jgi:hypothetical protein